MAKGNTSFGEFLAEIDSNLDRMNEVNLSTAFHRVAKTCRAEHKDTALRDPRFNKLQERVGGALWHSLPLLGSARGKQVPMSAACVCWAHATLRLPETHLFTEVARRCAPYMKDFKNLEVANLLWAFAKLGETGKPSTELFYSAADDVLERPMDFSVVNLSTLAWAFATARVKHSEFFQSVARRVEQNAAKAESQEIANTLWAFATAGAFDKKLFDAVGSQAARKLESFKAQEAANAAWAFGRAGLQHLTFFNALEQHLRACSARDKCLRDFAPQHLSMILGACSQLHPAEGSEEEGQGRSSEGAEAGAHWKALEKAVEEEEAADFGDDHDAEQPTAAEDVIGDAGGSSDKGRALAWQLALLVLPECVQKLDRFKVEEAAKVLGACSKLGLKTEVVGAQSLQQQASAAAKEFVDKVTQKLPAALTYTPPSKR